MIQVSKCGVDFKVVKTTDTLDDFWRTVFPNWEDNTYNTIIPHLDANKTFLDIGAWQGPISMVAQKFSKQCICFEPDPIAYSNLQRNLELNGFTNIIAVNKAVSQASELTLGHATELGGGGTSYLTPTLTFNPQTISIAQILEEYELNEDNISVIKIDVEGYESKLLQDTLLKSLNVPMHISLHPFLFSDRDEYFGTMAEFFETTNYIQARECYEIFLNKRL
jgi:FkbM family methyltransferase